MPQLAFGIFDFDPDTGELRRNGLPVRLQAQPAKVLAALLANPDEVVTRESLHEAVWKGETFVDFERGLNFCIGQLRAALEDDADAPRYIRTVPRRGYQLVAAAEVFPEESASAELAGRRAAQIQLGRTRGYITEANRVKERRRVGSPVG